MRGKSPLNLRVFEGDTSGNKIEVNDKKRYCLKCKKKLSRYNLNKYCHQHLFIEQELRDEETDKKRVVQYGKWKKRYLKKYVPKKGKKK